MPSLSCSCDRNSRFTSPCRFARTRTAAAARTFAAESGELYRIASASASASVEIASAPAFTAFWIRLSSSLTVDAASFCGSLFSSLSFSSTACTACLLRTRAASIETPRCSICARSCTRRRRITRSLMKHSERIWISRIPARAEVRRERSRRFAARVSTTAATWCDCGSSAVDRQNIASGRDGCLT